MITQETVDKVIKFRDDRNWKQFHNPKDLAISISLEAAELLEVFQWSADDVICENKKDKIREELADVVNYCILMADAFDLDMDEIVVEKIRKNNEKYPVEKARDSAKKYDKRYAHRHHRMQRHRAERPRRRNQVRSEIHVSLQSSQAGCLHFHFGYDYYIRVFVFCK